MREGNYPAFNEIYSRFGAIIFKEALRKLGDEDQAKDITQDIFTKLWCKRESLPEVNNLAGYLITATKHCIFNFFQNQQVQSKYITSLNDYVNTGNIAHTDYLIREKEWTKYINDAIETLTSK